MHNKDVISQGAELSSLQKKTDLIIRNVSILDVVTRKIADGYDIRVINGRIEETGKSLAFSDSAAVVSGEGLFAVPGLIDLHVHLVWDGAVSPLQTMQSEGNVAAALRGVSNAIASLKKGVTTLRDVGSPDDIAVDIANAFDSGLLFGPRVVPLGRIVQPTYGHVPEIGYVANGVHEVTVAVRKLKERGVKGIKMASTGGVYGPEEIGPAVYTFDEMRAIVEEAHRLNMKVSTHALGEEGIRLSVEAGVDTIEHGAGIPPDLLRKMKGQGTALIPTLAVYCMLAESSRTIPEEYVEKAKRVAEWHKETFKNAMKEGVLIALGTDAGSPNFGPHPSLHKELETMVRFGMTPWEALAAATYNAATVLGMEHSLGKIEPGFLADIVLVDGNPEQNVNALRNVIHVFKGGNAVALM